MAVSKRLRFEVLRRDNHTCRYCGGSAPDVALTVDHVVPKTLGGADEPSNLVAACRDCNSGKSATPMDAPLINDVASDAVRWAAAMRQAGQEIARADAEMDAILNAVATAWKPFYMPADWTASVVTFIKAGLSQSDLLAMVDIAYAKRGIGSNQWSYFCGCCWNRVRQMQDRATELVNAASSPPMEPAVADAQAATTLSTCWSSDEMWSYASDLADRIEEALGYHVSATSYDGRCDHGADCKDMLCRLCALTTVYATVVLPQTEASHG